MPHPNPGSKHFDGRSWRRKSSQRPPFETPAKVMGTCRPRYTQVRDTFADLLRADERAGAAVAAYVDGELVVDLWGGSAGDDTEARWEADTLAITFSCSKGLLATCAIRAAQDRLLDLDGPIAEYWPAFGGAGKARITARTILAHRAGLAALDRRFTLDEVLAQAPVLRALENQAPWWRPGTTYAYHAMTYGWLVAEVLSRATGMPLEQHFRRLVEDTIVPAADRPARRGDNNAFEQGPAPDTWLGVPAPEVSRVATAAWDRDRTTLDFPEDGPTVPWTQRIITRAVTLGDALEPELVGPGNGLNQTELLTAGIPALGVISTARSLAHIWSRTVVGTDAKPPLLTAETIRDVTRCLSTGPGFSMRPPPYPRWATGYMLRSRLAPMLSDVSFGHDGAGGQLCFADPDAGVGFAFLTNRLRNRDDDRAERLVDALRSSLSLDSTRR